MNVALSCAGQLVKPYKMVNIPWARILVNHWPAIRSCQESLPAHKGTKAQQEFFTMDGQISMCRGLPTNALSAILYSRGLASLVMKALRPESGSSVSGLVQGLRRCADETGRGREIDRLNERLRRSRKRARATRNTEAPSPNPAVHRELRHGTSRCYATA